MSCSENTDSTDCDWDFSINPAKEITRLRAAQHWISVDEQLPERNKEIEIAYWDGCYMCRGFGEYDGRSFYEGQQDLNEFHGWKVTHWRKCIPLPEPPEVKE